MINTSFEIAQRCKSILENHYGPSMKGLVLYGSAARDQATAESDMDMLVLLGKQFDYFTELRRIIDLLYPVQLDSERLISAKPAAELDYKQGKLQLYRNAGREGLHI